MNQFKIVTPQALAKWRDEGQAVLVDVRDHMEYAYDHIPGAISLPLSQIIDGGIFLPLHDKKKLVFYCEDGKRSRVALNNLSKDALEGEEIHILEGGLKGWRKESLPMKRFPISIDRQTQIVAGSMLYIFVMIGLTIDPRLTYLAILPSFGLLIAGITGWCGMSKLLAKLPWNKF